MANRWRQDMNRSAHDQLAAGNGGQPRMLLGPGADPTMWTAHRLLLNAGYAPDWETERRDLDATIDAARDALWHAWQQHEQTLMKGQNGYEQAAFLWDQAVENFRGQAAELNPRIRAYNLKTRVVQMQIDLLDVEEEVARSKQR